MLVQCHVLEVEIGSKTVQYIVHIYSTYGHTVQDSDILYRYGTCILPVQYSHRTCRYTTLKTQPCSVFTPSNIQYSVWPDIAISVHARTSFWVLSTVRITRQVQYNYGIHIQFCDKSTCSLLVLHKYISTVAYCSMHTYYTAYP